MKHAIGYNIRRARLLAGMTQVQLSEATGIAQPDLSSYETGTTEPLISSLYRIARATNTDHYPLLWWTTTHNDNG